MTAAVLFVAVWHFPYLCVDLANIDFVDFQVVQLHLPQKSL